MITIKSENVKPFDVDGTLICAPEDSTYQLDVLDPIFPGQLLRVGVNRAMVRLLREEASRGAYIIVWSRGGYAWASEIVRALDLKKEVSLVLSKPLVYFDDCDVQDWLKDRVFIRPDIKYKR
jgi:hypothetical protein